MLRYHSLYPWHKEGSYAWLEDEHDKAMKPWVKLFNKYGGLAFHEFCRQP
jgi:inositol oxygenase